MGDEERVNNYFRERSKFRIKLEDKCVNIQTINIVITVF